MLSSALLGSLHAGGRVVIGAATSGLITANAYSWGNNVSLYSGASVTLNGLQTMGAHNFWVQTAWGERYHVGGKRCGEQHGDRRRHCAGKQPELYQCGCRGHHSEQWSLVGLCSRNSRQYVWQLEQRQHGDLGHR